MLEWVSLVIVPLLVAVVARTGQLRKENNEQHADTANSLKLIYDSIRAVDAKADRIETKVDTHLGEHTGAEKRMTKRVKAAL